MLELLKLKQESFGLDISDRSIKIVKLKKKKQALSLASYGELEMRAGIIEEGEVKDQKALVEAIKQSLKRIKGEKLRTNYAVVSLPEDKAFLQVIQLPIIEEKEIKEAVYYEAENHIPLPIDDVYLDSQIVKPIVDSLDHLDILIAAMPKKTVDPYVISIKQAGLVPQVLETESQSISRALVKNEISPFPLLIIDIGSTKTCFIIFSGYSLRFTSTIHFSSQEITETLSKNLGITLNEVEDLKIKSGFSEKFYIKRADGTELSIETDKILKILEPFLADLVNQIKVHIGYYESYTSHEHLKPDIKGVKKVLICGEGANLKGLDDFLAMKLKIPVEIANPWINILPLSLKEIPGLPLNKALIFTTTLGLGLRALKETG